MKQLLLTVTLQLPRALAVEMLLQLVLCKRTRNAVSAARHVWNLLLWRLAAASVVTPSVSYTVCLNSMHAHMTTRRADVRRHVRR
jgi:hypothetical protein